MIPRRPSTPIARTFRALRSPNYRLFWFGQLFSLMGTWMQSIALAWLVLRLTNSPLALGTVTTIQYGPSLLLSLFGGVLADRTSKRAVLIATQSVMAAQALAMGLLTSTGHIQLPWIYALAAALGIALAVDNPTRQAFVMEMVGPEDLPNAIALNSTQFNAARIAGPALGGLTIAALGVAGNFYVNAASFLAVILSLLLMRPGRLFAAPRLQRGNVFAQVAEGIRYSLGTPSIALMLLVIGVVGTFGYNFTVILPLIARYVLHAGPVGFGVLTSPLAAGSLIAALAIAYKGWTGRRAVLIGAGGFSILLFGLALSTSWLTAVPLLVAIGAFSILFTATANTRLQLITPARLRGRVMGIYTLLFLGSTPIGSFVVGALAERGGVQRAVAETAGICILGVAAGLLYAYRARHQPGPEPPARRPEQDEGLDETRPSTASETSHTDATGDYSVE